MDKKIIVTKTTRLMGKTYRRVEEMPPEVRQAYEQMQGMVEEALEAEKTAEVTEIIVNDKRYASVEEMPSELRAIYLRALAASGELPGTDLQKVSPALPARQRTITIIEGHSTHVEDADEDAKKPGLGCFFAILAGITVIYLMHLLIPGKHEPWGQFIARQPTWENFGRGWTFFVLPIASFLWLGCYLSQRRFFGALSLALKILMAVLVLLIIAMILSILAGF